MLSEKNLDLKLLERLIKETTSATDRNGYRVIYFIPLREDCTNICQYILSKYGIKMQKYQSSLNPFPVLKINFNEVDALSETAKEFLFSINVHTEKLLGHLEKRLKEMNAKQR